MAVSIFFGLLALLSIVNVLIHMPIAPPTNISDLGPDGVQPGGGRWYVLERGCYTVGEPFGKVSYTNSTFRFSSTDYTYYFVTVKTTGQEPFIMPVCAKGIKAEQLMRGDSVTLYGMASKLTDQLKSQMDEKIGNDSAQKTYISLNDGGDTIIKRWLSAGIFAVIAMASIVLIIRITRK